MIADRGYEIAVILPPQSKQSKENLLQFLKAELAGCESAKVSEDLLISTRCHLLEHYSVMARVFDKLSEITIEGSLRQVNEFIWRCEQNAKLCRRTIQKNKKGE